MPAPLEEITPLWLPIAPSALAGYMAKMDRATSGKTFVKTETTRAAADATGVPAAALSVRGLSYFYGSRRALDDINFDILPGQFTALLGPNGAGKTTLFALVTRLFDSRTGDIIINGLSIADSGSAALKTLGIVFQQPTLDLDLTVRQNLKYFGALRGFSARQSNERMMNALSSLNMAERVDEKVRILNGGHRRRVEIARALLHGPKLLLLDEATVGLDAGTRAMIVEHVHRLATDQNIAVLWATHLIDEIADDDQLIVLHQGQIISHGRVGAVVSKSGAPDLEQAFSRLTGQRHKQLGDQKFHTGKEEAP